MGPPNPRCERAREWVSLELDAELSELEHALLRSHLRRCDGCAVFAREVRGFSTALRAAAPEQPCGRAGAIARRSASRGVLQVLAAAAVVAVAVGFGSLVGALTSSSGSQTPTAAAIAATQQPYVEQKLLALDARLAERPHGGEAVPV